MGGNVTLTNEQSPDTVEVIFRYDRWHLAVATVTRDVVGDYYEAVEMLKQSRDFDDCLAVARSLKWVGTGSGSETQILRHAGRLVLPKHWAATERTERVAQLLTLMGEFID
jgi:hypothetical protein